MPLQAESKTFFPKKPCLIEVRQGYTALKIEEKGVRIH